jgi:hypothetical protein
MFDRVFGHEARQEDVFEATSQPLLKGLLDGYNATIFAYGVSLSQKFGIQAYLITGYRMRENSYYQRNRGGSWYHLSDYVRLVPTD